MKNAALAITVCTLFLGCTAIPGFAQEPKQQDRMETQEQTQNESSGMEMGYGMGEDRPWRHRMMGEGGMMGHGMTGHRGMMNPLALRIIFALMDADGDGTISLEEFQAAHEKIFKAMDVDKDGTVSFEEMMNFLHGSGRPQAPSSR